MGNGHWEVLKKGESVQGSWHREEKGRGERWARILTEETKKKKKKKLGHMSIIAEESETQRERKERDGKKRVRYLNGLQRKISSLNTGKKAVKRRGKRHL